MEKKEIIILKQNPYTGDNFRISVDADLLKKDFEELNFYTEFYLGLLMKTILFSDLTEDDEWYEKTIERNKKLLSSNYQKTIERYKKETWKNIAIVLDVSPSELFSSIESGKVDELSSKIQSSPEARTLYNIIKKSNHLIALYTSIIERCGVIEKVKLIEVASQNEEMDFESNESKDLQKMSR